MTATATVRSLLLATSVVLAACAHQRTECDGDKVCASAAEVSGEPKQAIVSALQQGRYADAVLLARRAKVSKVEADFAVGEIILQGHADARAVQPPRESIEEGLQLLEQAALAGHQPAISGLAATFHTGLRRDNPDSFLLEPDSALNECWERAKTMPQAIRSCVGLRRQR